MTQFGDIGSEATEATETQDEEFVAADMQDSGPEMVTAQDEESQATETQDEEAEPAIADEGQEHPQEPSPFPWEDGSAS